MATPHKKYIPPTAEPPERLMDADMKLAYAHRTLQRLDQFLMASLGPNHRREIKLTRHATPSLSGATITVDVYESNMHGETILMSKGSIALKDVSGEPVAGAAGSLIQEVLADFLLNHTESGNRSMFSGRDATQMRSIAQGAAPMRDYIGDSLDLVTHIRDEAMLQEAMAQEIIQVVDKKDSEPGPSRPPLNPILIRMREKFLTMTQLVVLKLEAGAEHAGVDDLESYLTSLRQAGLTESEMEWILYIPTDSLPGFDPES